MLAAALTFAVCTLGPEISAAATQPPPDWLPVGVRYDPDPDPGRRRTDLDNMRRLRFTVVALAKDGGETRELTPIDRLLAGDEKASVTMRTAELGTVEIDGRTADDVRERAWTLLANGARGILFDDWQRLQKNDGALIEAAAFAESLTRNGALYAPLRRVEATGDRRVTIDGAGSGVEAQWLESDEALVLIAINHAAEPREVTVRFQPAVPEAIWQNMLTGSAVNFVAGPEGPFYERTFAAREVLVLMILKRLK